jgi:Family of unknown function (DUF6290)
MCRQTDDPLKHVISFRLTDSEKTALEQLASFHGVKVSHLLRETVYLLEKDVNAVCEKLFGRESG